MGLVRLVCYRAECDVCGTVLEDYGDYLGMESPEEAARYAVDDADWTPVLNGSYALTGLLCPPCAKDGYPR